MFQEGRIGAFLELHIEQGPVLESRDAPIGIVSGISGPLWLTVEMTGFAGHAGSVPMSMRHDALLGSAKIIVALNELVRQESGVCRPLERLARFRYFPTPAISSLRR